MDPEAALERLRALVKEIDSTGGSDRDIAMDLAALADEMAQTFDGLDRWLTSGGHLPETWSR